MTDADYMHFKTLVAMVGILVAVFFAIMTAGCSTTEVAEASVPMRIEFEYQGYSGEQYGISAWVVTDTETGQQWLAIRATDGGAALAPLEGE